MGKKIIQEQCRVISNKRLGSNYAKIILESAEISRLACPGEFIEIKVNSSCDPLLRRPFSIHKIGQPFDCAGGRQVTRPEGRKVETKKACNPIEILYEIVGKGTEILSQKMPGEFVDVIGPLGNGFGYRKLQAANCAPILVAGGMGVAPLVFLAEKLREIQNPKSKIQNLVLIGAGTKSDILCEKEFKQLGYDVKIATDDGSRGFKGRVTDLLNTALSAKRYPCLSGRQALSAIYACGPQPMLQEVKRIAQEYDIYAQISLEAHMACGIGACLGCVVKTKDGFKRVCKEGPVFDAKDIIWQDLGGRR